MIDYSFKKYHLKLKAVGEGIFYKYDLDIEQLQKYVDAYHYAEDILINGKTISSLLVDTDPRQNNGQHFPLKIT